MYRCTGVQVYRCTGAHTYREYLYCTSIMTLSALFSAVASVFVELLALRGPSDLQQLVVAVS